MLLYGVMTNGVYLTEQFTWLAALSGIGSGLGQSGECSVCRVHITHVLGLVPWDLGPPCLWSSPSNLIVSPS